MQSIKMLKKCLEELKKENPKIDYIIGILETVIETGDAQTGLVGSSTINIPSFGTTPLKKIPETISVDEGIDKLVKEYESGPIGVIN